MSGSGGSGSGGGIRPGPTGGGCDIVEQMPLNSPKPDVVPTLRVGEELDVQLQGRSLVATTRDGRLAGSLTPASLLDLIRCIEAGHKYKAVVMRIQGGLCLVEVRPS